MKQPVLFFVLLLTLSTRAQRVQYAARAQHLQYTGPFAPSTGHFHPAEAPYRQSICLNGNWQFQPIPLPSNFKEGIDATPTLPKPTDDWDKTPIRIPSPWNVNSFADRQGQGGDFCTYPSYPKSWATIKMAWLKKDFTIPSDWKGKRISLYFEALAGDASIIVNGKPAGHKFDIFLPFSIDITDLVNYGKNNEVRIGIRKPSLFDRKGQYGRRPYQAGSFWGQHIAGIWQDVYVEALPPVRITNTYIRPLLDSNTLRADITITNETTTAQTLTLSGDIYRWLPAKLPDPSTNLSTTVTLSFPAQNITIPPNSTINQTLSITVNNQLQKWSPDTPNLYGLVAYLSLPRAKTTKEKKLDASYTRFGWRQTRLKDGQFLLNNQPFTLKGDSWHFLGIPQMTRRYAWAWFTALHDAHLNAVRLHAQPYPQFYLDIADEMGILVLDETAVWASDGGPKLDDPDFWQDSRDQLQQQLLRDRNHPSVFGWSVSNEVKPVIRNVMHGPQSMMDTLLNNFTQWAAICKRLDPTRPWISADGEDDGDGRLPLYIVHYGGTDAMDRARRSGKPWGVGEAGNAYYATPQQVAGTNGARAYQSFLGRMEGVATSSWSSLMAQRSRDAVYRSVFNLVWYGLQPLPLGMKDTTKPPTLDDGIFFTSFKEGQPGVQPERLGPYCTTLNPGYDPSLPLYLTWPLFDAIKDASSPSPSPQFTPRSPATTTQTPIPTPDIPASLVVDATQTIPTEKIRQTLSKGGTVLILGLNPANINEVNHFLPSPLTLTPRTASSLDIVTPDPITKNIAAADLYFSELRPPEIITNGIETTPNSIIILQACNTDWLKWNKQPEYAKTAMVLRSERESKPSGACLIRIPADGGNLLLSTLPANPHLQKAQQLIEKIETNSGARTDTTATTLLQPNGDLTPDLRNLQPSGKKDQAWLDLWISSPRSLEDLLSEPDIPVVDLQTTKETLEVRLNDKPVTGHLRLLQGWNHFRILLQQTPDGYTFTGRLTSNHPEFLKTLSATTTKP
ncbi:MAG: glycoside hydrolase family 2 [Bacteroidetes bacterium]|nr:glycoside hydrolase family 2 [Bacteroidota bacterium]